MNVSVAEAAEPWSRGRFFNFFGATTLRCACVKVKHNFKESFRCLCYNCYTLSFYSFCSVLKQGLTATRIKTLNTKLS